MKKNRNYSHIKEQKSGKKLDAYMCFFCLKCCNSNHGHHIIYYSEAGEANINNIITLCPECHRLYHSKKLKIDIGRF